MLVDRSGEYRNKVWRSMTNGTSGLTFGDHLIIERDGILAFEVSLEHGLWDIMCHRLSLL